MWSVLTKKRFIGRIEDSEDVKAVYEYFQLDYADDFFGAGFNKHWSRSNQEAAAKFYAGLNPQTIYNLIKFYEADYTAFGYKVMFSFLSNWNKAIQLPFDWLSLTPIELDEPDATLSVYISKKRIFRDVRKEKFPYFKFSPVYVPKPIPTDKPLPVTEKPPVQRVFISNFNLG